MYWPFGSDGISSQKGLRSVSWLKKGWLLCQLEVVVLHCSIFFEWNKIVRVIAYVMECTLNISLGTKYHNNSATNAKHLARKCVPPIFNHAWCSISSSLLMVFFQLSRVPNYQERMKAILFKENFAEKVEEVRLVRPSVGLWYISK